GPSLVEEFLDTPPELALGAVHPPRSRLGGEGVIGRRVVGRHGHISSFECTHAANSSILAPAAPAVKGARPSRTHHHDCPSGVTSPVGQGPPPWAVSCSIYRCGGRRDRQGFTASAVDITIASRSRRPT